MRLLGKEYLFFYVIISIFAFLALSPIGNFSINNLLADLTQQLIIAEVNPIRESYGFLSLKVNKELTKAAEMKAQDMIDRDYFDHIGPEGETPWSFLSAADYDYVAAGENLAIDVGNTTSLVNAWLNSPSHAKNIFNGYFIDIGLGIAEGELDGRKTKVVVMFLGRERTENLAMASNISDDYEEIMVAEVEKSAKPRDLDVIENVKAEEILVTKNIDERALYRENLFLAATDEKITDLPLPESKAMQIILLDDAPEVLRLMLTILYAGVIFLAMLELLFTRERKNDIIFNSMILLALTIFIWIP